MHNTKLNSTITCYRMLWQHICDTVADNIIINIAGIQNFETAILQNVIELHKYFVHFQKLNINDDMLCTTRDEQYIL